MTETDPMKLIRKRMNRVDRKLERLLKDLHTAIESSIGANDKP